MMSINYTDWKRDKDCSWANNHALDYPGFYPFQRLHLSTVLHSYRYRSAKKGQSRYEICSLAEIFFFHRATGLCITGAKLFR